MQRRPLASVGLFLVALGGILTSCARKPEQDGPPRRPPTTLTVEVVFNCTGLRSVDPWLVDAVQGDTIQWVLDSARSDVSEIRIDSKERRGRFPFPNRPLRGRKGQPAAGRNMNPGAKGNYQYNIAATCPGVDGDSVNSVIDPDIIIDVTRR